MRKRTGPLAVSNLPPTGMRRTALHEHHEMNLLGRPAARVVVETPTRAFLNPELRALSTYVGPQTKAIPWTCTDCRRRGLTPRFRKTGDSRVDLTWRRQFSRSLIRRDEKPSNPSRPAIIAQATSSTRQEASISESNPSSLPSHTEQQRWHVSKRWAKLMDGLLARASIAGQHINVYTGTDYTGIESLRNNIIEQEQKVKDCHSAADEAKRLHHDAHTAQTSAQREIVGLLERKSSWSPADLERYMSLVRSEHTNEQAVQAARDNLATSEKNLEDARSLLERLERKQYHEEQIWSDTIRRNSTWVTFGLMGVNILLLLAQIAIFEPYRRQKIVKDVKHALDEKTLPIAETGALEQRSSDAALDQHANERLAKLRAFAEKLESFASLSEERQMELIQDALDRFGLNSKTSSPLDAFLPPNVTAGDVRAEPRDADAMPPGEASDFVGTTSAPTAAEEPIPSSWDSTYQAYNDAFRDLFSDRAVQIKRFDITNTALQGAATGMAMMGLLFVLLRPK